jgi:hypothetical protein
MKFINKDDVARTTLSNYERRFVRMEVYLLGLQVMIVANDDGTIKEYDEDDDEQIEADVIQAFNHWEEVCISASLVEIEKDECFKDEERWVTSIEENKITEFKNPLYK